MYLISIGVSCCGSPVPVMAQTVKNLTWVQSLCQEDSLEKGMVTHSSILPGEVQGQRSLVGYSPSMGSQSQTRLSDYYFPMTFLVAQAAKNLPAMWEIWVQSLGREDPLEEEMATHSSMLTWETPWIEEPGGMQSMGS